MADKPVYLKNAKGAVHSVTEEHLEALKVTHGGKSFLPSGWETVTEAEARKANPDLFGGKVNRRPSADES